MADTKIVGSLVAFLIVIMVGVMVYFSVTTNVDMFGEQSETFTSCSGGVAFTATSNASAWGIKLDNSPMDDSNLNITCYNATGSTESYPTFTLSGTKVEVVADAADEFSQVNATYTSNAANDEDSVTTEALSVFSLLPIVAMVVVGMIILAYVVGFGGKKGGF